MSGVRFVNKSFAKRLFIKYLHEYLKFQQSCNLEKFEMKWSFKVFINFVDYVFMQGNKKEYKKWFLISTFSFSWFVLVFR